MPSVAELRARQMELTVASLRNALDTDDDELDPFRTAVRSLRNEFDELDVAAAALKLVHEASGAMLDEQEIPDAAQRRERTERGEQRDGPRSSGPTAKIYIGLGKHHRIRPGDLVGAIANETHLSGREIGPITISDRHSIVGVPAAAVDQVIEAMRRTTVKGSKPFVRRFTDEPGGGRSAKGAGAKPVPPWKRPKRERARTRSAPADRRRTARRCPPRARPPPSARPSATSPDRRRRPRPQRTPPGAGGHRWWC